tara:strand:- start:432 stop:1166 length:735 start_codon:yes stop_codon:yes gene_type:complete
MIKNTIYYTMLILFLSSLYAQELPPASEGEGLEIVVEAHKDFEVYVAPVQYHIHDDSIEAKIPYDSVFMYANRFSHMAKVKSGAIYEPVTMHGGIKVYNKDTISYVWEDCDYNRDYRKCSFRNDHYYLETHITVDENEISVSMSLYDSDLQIVGSSIRTNQKVINWIKQQEEVINNSSSSNPVGANSTCVDNSCNTVPINNTTQDNTIIKKKEELPLKWEMPPKLLNKMIHQASLGLWAGVKIN